MFSLDYHVDDPINTVFAPDVMIQYLRIFNFLWRLKRAEHMLSESWERQSSFTRTSKTSKLFTVIAAVDVFSEHTSYLAFHVATSEMIHFISQVQYYILFEVCTWEIDSSRFIL